MLPAALPDRPLHVIARGASLHPQRAALTGARDLSYGGLQDSILELAAVLAERGVVPGDRVMIAAENTLACVVLLYAVQQLKAWPAIVNPRLARTEIAALKDCCAPRLMIFAVEGSPVVRELAAGASVDRYSSAQAGAILFGPTVSGTIAEPADSNAAEEVGLLVFTSGTLGLPKAVMWSHAALVNLGRVLAASRMTSGGDVVQGIAPLSHIMGISNLMSAMYAGATLKLMPRLELAALARAIGDGSTTHLSFVPTLYSRLIDFIEVNDIDVSANRLRYISCGGAPLHPGLKGSVERLLGLRLVNGYGMTECAPGLRTHADRDAAADCIGWPEEGVEVRIAGQAAEGATDVGELLLRSPSMMMGYYREAGQTAATLRDGWLATGDLARRLPDGSIAIVGRIKEMIIRSGFNVYPAEVEAALQSIPGVLLSGVVGLPMVDGNEEIIAFVQLRDAGTLDEEGIRTLLRDKLTPYKRPGRIVFVDGLPIGPTGKIWKMKLKEMAAEIR